MDHRHDDQRPQLTQQPQQAQQLSQQQSTTQQDLEPNDFSQPQLQDDPAESGAAGAKRNRPAPAKTFQCRGFGECQMVFSRSEHLARHIRKHTGERPFSCHCGKQFSRLDNLRQHAQTVHSDKQTENETMMRDLTSLHTQLAAKTSKVNRDVYSTNPPASKHRPGEAMGPIPTVRTPGAGFDPGQGGPYPPPPAGAPGIAYHQLPPGYQPQAHPGYPMIPPGQYDGYHPTYYPQSNAPGQPYPTYPPSFGPLPGAVYSGGNMPYPPYPQGPYPPVSPNQYRGGTVPGYTDQGDMSPGPHTPLTPLSNTPLSANSQAGQSFLGSEPSASQSQAPGTAADGSFLGSNGSQQSQSNNQGGGSPATAHDPGSARSFTDADGHLAPPQQQQPGSNHSFRTQHGSSPIPVSPVSVHSTGYDDGASVHTNGSDTGASYGVNGDVVSRGADSHGRRSGYGHPVGPTSAASGFDGASSEQQPYLAVNGSNGTQHHHSRVTPPGFEHRAGGHQGEVVSSVNNNNKFEQGFRQRGAGWESGFRNPAAASRDHDNDNRGEHDERRPRTTGGAGSRARSGDSAMGFRERGDRHATDPNLGEYHRSVGARGDERFAPDKQTEISPGRPSTGHGGHGRSGHGSTVIPSRQQSGSQYETGHPSSLGFHPQGGISSQRPGSLQQRQGSRGDPHSAHTGVHDPPDLVSATAGHETGSLPPLAAVIANRSPYERERERERHPRDRSPTTSRRHPYHGEHSSTRDGFIAPPPPGLHGASEYDRPGTAPAAYVDGGHGPRPPNSRSVLSRSGSSRLDRTLSSGTDRLGRDSGILGGESRRLPPPATSAGLRTTSSSAGTRTSPREYGDRRPGSVSSAAPPNFGGGFVPPVQFVFGVGGKHNVHTSPTSESPFSFHPPDVPYGESIAPGNEREPGGLGQFYLYRPTSGRPFSGVSSIGESSISSFGGRPSTSGSVLGGSRPFSSSGMGYGPGPGSRAGYDGRHGVRPGTAISTTDPASYAFSRGTKRPHTADSSDGSSVGGRDSPYKFASRSGGFGFDRPSTAADDDGRPPSRRLSLMELCTPPTTSSGRPKTSTGRAGTFNDSLRPSTSDAGFRWPSKAVTEESDNDGGGGESPSGDPSQRKSGSTPSQKLAPIPDVWVENKSAPADVHRFADSVLRVSNSPSGSPDISRSHSVEGQRATSNVSPRAKSIQGGAGAVDRTRSPGQSSLSRVWTHSPPNESRRNESERPDSRSSSRTSTALPLRGSHAPDDTDRQRQLPSRPQSVLSTGARAGHVSPPARTPSTEYARSGSTGPAHVTKSDAKTIAIAGAAATPRNVTPSVSSEASRSSSRHHELSGSPGLLHNVRA